MRQEELYHHNPHIPLSVGYSVGDESWSWLGLARGKPHDFLQHNFQAIHQSILQQSLQLPGKSDLALQCDVSWAIALLVSGTKSAQMSFVVSQLGTTPATIPWPIPIQKGLYHDHAEIIKISCCIPLPEAITSHFPSSDSTRVRPQLPHPGLDQCLISDELG